jgi:hypothetical protein
MNRKRRIGIILFTLAIVLSILACGGAAPTPTATQPPPPTNTPVPPPEATEATTPNQLNVIALNGYKDTFNDWHIVGLVSNDTQRIVNDIEVEVEIFDANNNSLYKDVAYTSLYTIAPGEVTPFDLWVYDELPAADHFTAVIVGQGSANIERAVVDFEGVTQVVDSFNDIDLTGEMVNNTGGPVDISGLAVAYFDNSGELVTIAYASVIIRHLEAGESGPFRFTVYGPEDTTSSLSDYQLYVDASVADPADMVDLALSDEHYHYMDAYDNFHLVGSVTNNTDLKMNVSLVAGIYDDAGNCLDASTKSLPVYSLAPGETLPYDFDSWGPMDYVSGTHDKATTYHVMIDWYWTWDTTTELVDLATQDDSNTYDKYQGKFIGYVLNNSGKDLTGATVIVTLYEKGTNKPLATDYDWIFDDIADGATAAYEVNVNIWDGFDPNNVEYVILVKGELP